MRITIANVAALKPCASRFNNFKDNNPEFNGTFDEFIALDNITYDDKVWVAVRMLSKNQLVRWSIMCAESTQHIFEAKYPKNKAVSNLLAFMNTIQDFDNISEAERNTLRELRYTAAYAADTAAYAAAAAADAAAAAADTAAYAADAATAYAAAAAAYAADVVYAAATAYAAAAAADTAAYAAAAAADAAAYAAAAYAAVDACAVAKEKQRNLNLLYLASLVDGE